MKCFFSRISLPVVRTMYFVLKQMATDLKFYFQQQAIFLGKINEGRSNYAQYYLKVYKDDLNFILEGQSCLSKVNCFINHLNCPLTPLRPNAQQGAIRNKQQKKQPATPIIHPPKKTTKQIGMHTKFHPFCVSSTKIRYQKKWTLRHAKRDRITVSTKLPNTRERIVPNIRDNSLITVSEPYDP